MAAGALAKFRTDYSIAVTGIAGPDGGSEEKPVGTFYIGFSTSEETQSFHHFFSSSRDFVRRFAAFTALDTVRRYLLTRS